MTAGAPGWVVARASSAALRGWRRAPPAARRRPGPRLRQRRWSGPHLTAKRCERYENIMISVAADLTLDKPILNEAGSGNDVTTGVAMHAWSTSGSSRRYQSDGFAACSGRIAPAPAPRVEKLAHSGNSSRKISRAARSLSGQASCSLCQIGWNSPRCRTSRRQYPRGDAGRQGRPRQCAGGSQICTEAARPKGFEIVDGNRPYWCLTGEVRSSPALSVGIGGCEPPQPSLLAAP